MDANDMLLVKQLKDRKEEAYVFLFKQYYNRLYRFAANYLCDPEVAHDIVQELFTDIFEKSAELNIVTSVKAYLFMATRNRCLSFLRSLKIRDSYNRNMLEAHLYSDTVDAIEDSSVLDELQAIVDKMPPKMREVFRLRVIEDYKFKEIATELKITENNAKVQMSSAIRMIREKLPDLKKRLFFLVIW
ncbi:MAG TPA: RNA polymerase sigma-70 factor [Candidatus Butyricimonas faecavium]|nr:RNA polymerase sigma-70 factor [Candidatus Butyricimonas faecavium]